MSTDKIDPSKKDTTISSADDLTKTTNKGDVELNEEELKRVSGGLKITMTPVNVSSYQTGGTASDSSGGSGTK